MGAVAFYVICDVDILPEDLLAFPGYEYSITDKDTPIAGGVDNSW